MPAGRKIKPGLPGLADEIELATRQLVKSQRTFFRGQNLRLPQAHWFTLDEDQFRLDTLLASIYGDSYEKDNKK